MSIEGFWWVVLSIATGNFLMRWLPFWWLRHKHGNNHTGHWQARLETLGIMLIAAMLSTSSIPSATQAEPLALLILLAALTLTGGIYRRNAQFGLAIISGLGLSFMLSWLLL